MRFKSTLTLILLMAPILFAQSGRSMQGAFGAVTIDGKLWNQIALRPVLPFGKLSIALDLVFYIDQDGNIHDDEWDFSTGEKVKNSLIDKIYYIKYGSRYSGSYLKVGALDNVTMGYGILISHYTNTLLYPQVRKVGMEFVSRTMGLTLYGFTNDFKENMGVGGFRVSAPISNGFTGGFSWAGDRNQYLGLRDDDGDGRPDLVDDFPNNKDFWLDSDGDGLADSDELEWDIDGDGITDTLDSHIPGWNLDTTIVLDGDIQTKPDPLNINEEAEGINSFALDVGMPLFRDGLVSLDIYAQYATLLGNTTNPIDGTREDVGYGIIPLGLSARLGPASFNLEFRMVPKGNFEFGYFNRSYEIERATFQSISGYQGNIITKASKLGIFGKQNGFFSSMKLDMGVLFESGLQFQNLKGDQYNKTKNIFEDVSNQSFTATLKLKKPISKIQTASWFYQQRNVPNPFDFEYSESTMMGYNVGLKLGNGMILTYIFRRTFIDLDGNGDVLGEDEMVNMTSFETSFSF
ncbi:MAG: hypothetical protein HN920_05855 [Candidatus Marinimicrobia bacterium]|nr:hypothetical protein [Candidatus Neomarinimicrobiota bacterium]MBT7043046.1 hypothetical protein [Candidatus Neomarinimicrobiota bacterium]